MSTARDVFIIILSMVTVIVLRDMVMEHGEWMRVASLPIFITIMVISYHAYGRLTTK